MEQKPLNEFILECAESKGLSLDKIYLTTGVPKHYLEAIFEGEWKKLPAAPYARGYFKKLESALDLPDDQLWQLYKEEVEMSASGAKDKLPENRFAVNVKNRKWVWPVLLLLGLGVYVFLNFGHFLGIPGIEVNSPLSATTIISFSSFTLTGEIDPKDKLYINGEEVYVDKTGNFQKNYNLQLGLNTFELAVKRFLGKETKVVKQIIYQPESRE